MQSSESIRRIFPGIINKIIFYLILAVLREGESQNDAQSTTSCVRESPQKSLIISHTRYLL